jgi:uncharacterized membrane protein
MTQDLSKDKPAEKPKAGRKRLFLRGLALLLPTVLTVLILVKAYQFVDENFIGYVRAWVGTALSAAGFYDVFTAEGYAGEVVRHPIITPVLWFLAQVFALVLCVLFFYVVGLLIGTLLGRRMWQSLESRLMRFPVIRFVYPMIRQMTDFVFSERKVHFRSVVAIEYPRKGTWTIGFLTGRGFEALEKKTTAGLVAVFVPSSPTPVTGWVVFVAEQDVIQLDITVDDALRLMISGGVILPGHQANAGEEGRKEGPEPAETHPPRKEE